MASRKSLRIQYRRPITPLFSRRYSQAPNVDKSWVSMTHLYFRKSSNFNGKRTDKNKYILLESTGFSYLKKWKEFNNAAGLSHSVPKGCWVVGDSGVAFHSSSTLPLVPRGRSTAWFPSSVQCRVEGDRIIRLRYLHQPLN